MSNLAVKVTAVVLPRLTNSRSPAKAGDHYLFGSYEMPIIICISLLGGLAGFLLAEHYNRNWGRGFLLGLTLIGLVKLVGEGFNSNTTDAKISEVKNFTALQNSISSSTDFSNSWKFPFMVAGVVVLLTGLWANADLHRENSSSEHAQKLLGAIEKKRDDILENWNVKESQSTMDDTSTVILSKFSTGHIGKSVFSNRPVLYLRCINKTTSVVIGTDTFLNIEPMSLRYRLGNEKAQTVTWDVSTDFNSVGLWRGAGAIPFIKRLLKHKKAVFEIQPYSDSVYTFEFKLDGLEKHLPKLQKACGWW